MAFNFKNSYNKFVEHGNKLNQSLNDMIGKDVFGQMHPIEDPREFAPYSTFPNYNTPEPEEWSQVKGNETTLTLNGNSIFVSKNLDTCIKYIPFFKESATYYTDRFKYKYKLCVEDYDTLVHYFPDIYNEGLTAMLSRAHSLLLPFGLFSISVTDFSEKHINKYDSAMRAFCATAEIEEEKKQAAEALGGQLGNSMQLEGGGFGVKGAAKGIASAELFNAGMGLLGKFVAHENKMTLEEKEKVYSDFDATALYELVYLDYLHTFYTLVQTLADNGILNGTTTLITESTENMLKNLANPMFPKESVGKLLSDIISNNPFIPECYEIMKNKLGETEEVKSIIDYFKLE